MRPTPTGGAGPDSMSAMPQTTAFVPGTALPARRATAARSSRRKLARPLVVACARTPDGDEAWMDMAKKLERGRPFGRAFGFGSEPEPAPTEPQWVYPEGDDFSTPEKGAGGAEAADEVLEDPWSTWRTALDATKNDGEEGGEGPAGRDPTAETDFWRKAVGEVVQGVSGDGVAEDGTTSDAVAEDGTTSDAVAEDGTTSDAVAEDGTVSDAGGMGGVGELAGGEDEKAEVLPTDPKELWNKASRVTADVADLQESLREEIAGFNPLQQSDAYRDIARELVGPSGADGTDGTDTGDMEGVDDGVGGDEDLGRTREDSSAENAAAGTGWNPDVDWKRYDDINRELQLKADASQRANVQSEAERLRDDALASRGFVSDQPSSQSYVDADGRELSVEEVAEALAAGAVIVDEAGNEVAGVQASPGGFGTPQVPLPETPAPVPDIGSPSVVFNPGAKAARRRSGRTYGGGTLDAEEEMAWLEERGFSRRDPEQDKAFWRDAAQEIGMSLSSDVDAGLEGESPEAELGSGSSVGDAVDGSAEKELEKGKVEETDGIEASPDVVGARSELTPDAEDLNVDSSSAWDLWNAGSSSWVRDVENAPPRDAAAEVDMWRSTANEIVPDALNPGESSAGTMDDAAISGNSSGSAAASNPWDKWNSASESWQADFNKSDATFASVDPGDFWRTSARSVAEGAGADFGAGPGKSASSGAADSRPAEKTSWDSGAPSAAWSTWQNSLSSSEDTGFGESTWSTRSDVASNKRAPTSAGNDMSLWTSVAREIGSDAPASNEVASKGDVSKYASIDSSASSTSDDASASNIDMWKAAAREVQPPKEAPDTNTSDEEK